MGLYGAASAGIDFRSVSETMQPVVEATFDSIIRIVDPDITGGTFNRMNNAVTGRTVEELWKGPARIQAMRWPNVATTRQEAVSLRTVVFHIPVSTDIDPEFIREGFRVQVVSANMSPELTSGLFVITSSINSSYAWDRRIETVQDQGASIT